MCPLSSSEHPGLLCLAEKEHVLSLELHQGCRASNEKYCPGFLLKGEFSGYFR